MAAVTAAVADTEFVVDAYITGDVRPLCCMGLALLLLLCRGCGVLDFRGMGGAALLPVAPVLATVAEDAAADALRGDGCAPSERVLCSVLGNT